MACNRPLQGTVRQRIYILLAAAEEDARTLSKQLRISEKEVLAHLPHVERSARSQGQQMIVRPSICICCGYTFKGRKRPTKPGRCPRCKESHLTLPAYRIK